ncbi:hypothetical protein K504DRAFT_530708 [Pleomassaria siparia CBS 279.74]|uniref:Uncharacterized protein n=1 Tax=Pleomassaria siparia CBS 279.74 TaxID=1314801 RepID=A0A6G1KLR4_9PLEO|nr:hypothetical protein K504DRAFT_530708 [Pleomassaria siparia CBS 279.74]
MSTHRKSTHGKSPHLSLGVYSSGHRNTQELTPSNIRGTPSPNSLDRRPLHTTPCPPSKQNGDEITSLERVRKRNSLQSPKAVSSWTSPVTADGFYLQSQAPSIIQSLPSSTLGNRSSFGNLPNLPLALSPSIESQCPPKTSGSRHIPGKLPSSPLISTHAKNTPPFSRRDRPCRTPSRRMLGSLDPGTSIGSPADIWEEAGSDAGSLKENDNYETRSLPGGMKEGSLRRDINRLIWKGKEAKHVSSPPIDYVANAESRRRSLQIPWSSNSEDSSPLDPLNHTQSRYLRPDLALLSRLPSHSDFESNFMRRLPSNGSMRPRSTYTQDSIFGEAFVTRGSLGRGAELSDAQDGETCVTSFADITGQATVLSVGEDGAVLLKNGEAKATLQSATKVQAKKTKDSKSQDNTLRTANVGATLEEVLAEPKAKLSLMAVSTVYSQEPVAALNKSSPTVVTSFDTEDPTSNPPGAEFFPQTPIQTDDALLAGYVYTILPLLFTINPATAFALKHVHEEDSFELLIQMLKGFIIGVVAGFVIHAAWRGLKRLPEDLLFCLMWVFGLLVRFLKGTINTAVQGFRSGGGGKGKGKKVLSPDLTLSPSLPLTTKGHQKDWNFPHPDLSTLFLPPQPGKMTNLSNNPNLSAEALKPTKRKGFPFLKLSTNTSRKNPIKPKFDKVGLYPSDRVRLVPGDADEQLEVEEHYLEDVTQTWEQDFGKDEQQHGSIDNNLAHGHRVGGDAVGDCRLGASQHQADCKYFNLDDFEDNDLQHDYKITDRHSHHLEDERDPEFYRNMERTEQVAFAVQQGESSAPDGHEICRAYMNFKIKEAIEGPEMRCHPVTTRRRAVVPPKTLRVGPVTITDPDLAMVARRGMFFVYMAMLLWVYELACQELGWRDNNNIDILVGPVEKGFEVFITMAEYAAIRIGTLLGPLVAAGIREVLDEDIDDDGA